MTTELQAAAAEIERNTRAEPSARSSDDVEDAFAYITPHPENHSAISLSANKLRAYGQTIRAHIAALEAEVSEQCRLHGIGSEREAKQLTKISNLEADNKRLREALGDAVATLSYIGKHYCVYKELAEDTFNEWAALARTDGK